MGDYLGEYRGECLSERMVEYIWNQYRLSPLIFHQGATDYARTHRDRVEAVEGISIPQIVLNNSTELSGP